MHHNAKLVAVLPYRDCLRDEGINSKSTSLSRISQEAIAIAVDFSHLRSVTALPNERAAAARPLREHDPVRVILCPLDKLGNKGLFSSLLRNSTCIIQLIRLRDPTSWLPPSAH